jgi:hypothetical protein
MIDKERIINDFKTGDRNNKEYYCENCNKEELESYVIDDIGSIFCSEDCFEQFYATDIENKDYNKRKIAYRGKK